MTNRFKDIINFIDEADDNFYGLMVTRNIGKCQGGQVADIRTDISSIGSLSGQVQEIADSGRPYWNQENGIFYEAFYKQERIIILGAGHVAVHLSMMAKMTGFYVIVIDDREAFANMDRFPYADQVICDSFADAIDTVKPGKNDYVVIVTREHAHDADCIRSLMKYDEPVYTGLMGSRKRIGIVFDKLKEEGFDVARIDRIHAPIGLNIGAKTIEEIDISIISEIVRVRRIDSVDKVVADRGDHNLNVIGKLAQIDEPCVIATILKDEGSTPRSAGAVMGIFADGRIIESIGGGFVEGMVIERAKELIGTGRFEIITLSMDGTSQMTEGMVCGGKVTVLLEDF